MRVTTWLLLERLGSDTLAILTESYLAGDGEPPIRRLRKKSNRGFLPKKSWHDIGRGGHVELIMHRIKKDRKEKKQEWRFKSIDVVNGVCASGDVGMIKMVAANVDKRYFEEGLAHFFDAIYADDLIERNDDLDVAKLLISLGADATGTCLMKRAAENWDVEMCRLLISNGNAERNSVFENAGRYGDPEMLSLVSPPQTFSEYMIMMEMACIRNKLEFVKIILSQRITSLHPALVMNIATRAIPSAVIYDNVNIVEYLLSQGADANVAFSEMCKYGIRGSFDILVKSGATTCSCGLAIDAHTPAYSKKRKANIDAEMRAAWVAKYPILTQKIVESADDGDSDDD